VIISPPDTREDNDSVNEADLSEVQRFWKDMMAIYSTPKNYQDRIIEKFKSGDGEDAPDLLIVVDKLLTGFDAPRNAVLYIDKRLKEHNILQAISRVNRVFEGKDYGLVIDYRGIFGEMNQALEIYAALEREGFDREDIEGALIDVRVEIVKLPTLHAAVWEDIFDLDRSNAEIESIVGTAAQADAIAARIKKVAITYGRLRQRTDGRRPYTIPAIESINSNRDQRPPRQTPRRHRISPTNAIVSRNCP
jgi:type I site-specific restriction-modification system R (restriction) subunit